ncbi:MAG: phage tail sheath family protein [Cetobacterium sp.]|uniref:phage tail sheath family protein n=1 Tax=Cetobacterium sp. TaxID=2071632 RepID=UPI003EE5AF68
MQFRHGLRTNEIDSGEKTYLSAKAPIVVLGAAPINMGDLTCVNQPVLIQNIAEATKYFGGVNKIEGFNISEVLYSAFQLFGVAPVLCINVLDPKKHKEAIVLENLIVKNKTLKIKQTGILPELNQVTSMIPVVRSQDELVYEVSYDENGYLDINFEEDVLGPVAVSFTRLNPELVTSQDIIGKVDIKTLKKEGLELVDDIFTKFSVIPGVGIAPGYTHDNELRTIMNTKFQAVNGGKWKSIIVADIPENVEYGEAIKWKKDNNAIDPEQMLGYGMGVLGNNTLHLSTLVACELLRGDAVNGGVPCDSPSNKSAKVSKIVYKDKNGIYQDLNLDEKQAELLNENGIITAIQTPGGFVLWGNRTSAFQPGGTTEKKDIWIHAKRLIQFICNTIAMNNQNEVDAKMTPMRAGAIRDSINQWLASLKAEEKISGARVEFRAIDNPGENIAGGKFVWYIVHGDVPIGENLVFNVKNSSEFIVETYVI